MEDQEAKFGNHNSDNGGILLGPPPVKRLGGMAIDFNRSAPLTSKATRHPVMTFDNLKPLEKKLNTIEELSRSKLDTDLNAQPSFPKSVFVADCSTPKGSSEMLVYRKLARNYLLLMTHGTLVLSSEPSMSRMAFNMPNENSDRKDSPRNLKNFTSVKPIMLLSTSMLSGIHAVESLLSRSAKFELIHYISSMIKNQDSQLNIENLLPLVREAITFWSSARRAKSGESISATASVGHSSHGLEGRLYSLYRSTARTDLETIEEFLCLLFEVSMYDSEPETFNILLSILLSPEHDKAEDMLPKNERDTLECKRELAVKILSSAGARNNSEPYSISHMIKFFFSLFCCGLAGASRMKLEEIERENEIKLNPKLYSNFFPNFSELSIFVNLLLNEAFEISNSENSRNLDIKIFTEDVANWTEAQVKSLSNITEVFSTPEAFNLAKLITGWSQGNQSQVKSPSSFIEMLVLGLLGDLYSLTDEMEHEDPAYSFKWTERGRALSTCIRLAIVLFDLSADPGTPSSSPINSVGFSSQFNSVLYMFFSSMKDLLSNWKEDTIVVRHVEELTADVLSFMKYFICSLASKAPDIWDSVSSNLGYEPVKMFSKVKKNFEESSVNLKQYLTVRFMKHNIIIPNEEEGEFVNPPKRNLKPKGFGFKTKLTLDDEVVNNQSQNQELKEPKTLVSKSDISSYPQVSPVEVQVAGKLLQGRTFLEGTNFRVIRLKANPPLTTLRGDWMEDNVKRASSMQEHSLQRGGRYEETPSVRQARLRVVPT